MKKYSNFSTYKNKLSSHGFEVGKHFSSYRFLYPIKDYNNNHLGSFEISYDAAVFTT
mgnify:CR=1 FL=1